MKALCEKEQSLKNRRFLGLVVCASANLLGTNCLLRKGMVINMADIRRHFEFYGMVQGVGFRYRAYHAAQINRITGWVRNRPDGSVELEVQGTEENIDKMILLIEKGSYIHIENCSVKDIPLENESGFYVIE